MKTPSLHRSESMPEISLRTETDGTKPEALRCIPSLQRSKSMPESLSRKVAEDKKPAKLESAESLLEVSQVDGEPSDIDTKGKSSTTTDKDEHTRRTKKLSDTSGRISHKTKAKLHFVGGLILLGLGGGLFFVIPPLGALTFFGGNTVLCWMHGGRKFSVPLQEEEQPKEPPKESDKESEEAKKPEEKPQPSQLLKPEIISEDEPRPDDSTDGCPFGPGDRFIINGLLVIVGGKPAEAKESSTDQETPESEGVNVNSLGGDTYIPNNYYGDISEQISTAREHLTDEQFATVRGSQKAIRNAIQSVVDTPSNSKPSIAADSADDDGFIDASTLVVEGEDVRQAERRPRQPNAGTQATSSAAEQSEAPKNKGPVRLTAGAVSGSNYEAGPRHNVVPSDLKPASTLFDPVSSSQGTQGHQEPQQAKTTTDSKPSIAADSADDDGFIDASTLVVEGEDVRQAERRPRQPNAGTQATSSAAEQSEAPKNKGPVRLTAGAVSGSNYEAGPRHNVVPSDLKPASTLFDPVSSSQGTQGHQEPQQAKTTTDSKPSIAADSADDDGFIDASTLVVEGEDVRQAERRPRQPNAGTQATSSAAEQSEAPKNKGPVRLTAGAVSGSNYEAGPRHNVASSDLKPASTLFDPVSSSQGTQGHQEPQQAKTTTDSKPSIAADSADDDGFIDASTLVVEGEDVRQAERRPRQPNAGTQATSSAAEQSEAPKNKGPVRLTAGAVSGSNYEAGPRHNVVSSGSNPTSPQGEQRPQVSDDKESGQPVVGAEASSQPDALTNKGPVRLTAGAVSGSNYEPGPRHNVVSSGSNPTSPQGEQRPQVSDDKESGQPVVGAEASSQPDASTNKGPVRLTAGAVSGSNYESGPRYNVVSSGSNPASPQGEQRPQGSNDKEGGQPVVSAEASSQPDASTNKGPVRLTAGAVSGSNYESGPRHNVVSSDLKPASTLFDPVSSSQGTQGHQEPQQAKTTTDSKPSIAADSADDDGFIDASTLVVEGEDVRQAERRPRQPNAGTQATSSAAEQSEAPKNKGPVRLTAGAVSGSNYEAGPRHNVVSSGSNPTSPQGEQRPQVSDDKESGQPVVGAEASSQPDASTNKGPVRLTAGAVSGSNYESGPRHNVVSSGSNPASPQGEQRPQGSDDKEGGQPVVSADASSQPDASTNKGPVRLTAGAVSGSNYESGPRHNVVSSGSNPASPQGEPRPQGSDVKEGGQPVVSADASSQPDASANKVPVRLTAGAASGSNYESGPRHNVVSSGSNPASPQGEQRPQGSDDKEGGQPVVSADASSQPDASTNKGPIRLTAGAVSGSNYESGPRHNVVSSGSNPASPQGEQRPQGSDDKEGGQPVVSADASSQPDASANKGPVRLTAGAVSGSNYESGPRHNVVSSGSNPASPQGEPRPQGSDDKEGGQPVVSADASSQPDASTNKGPVRLTAGAVSGSNYESGPRHNVVSSGSNPASPQGEPRPQGSDVKEGGQPVVSADASSQPDASANKGPVRLTAGAASGSNYESGPRHNVVSSGSNPASPQGEQRPQGSDDKEGGQPVVSADASSQPDASTNKGPVRLTAGAVSGSNYEPGPRHNVVPSDSKPASTLFDPVSSSQGTQGHQEPQQAKTTTDSKPSIAADSADDDGFIDASTLVVEGEDVRQAERRPRQPNAGTQATSSAAEQSEAPKNKGPVRLTAGAVSGSNYQDTGEISTTKLESKVDNHVGQFRAELNIPVNASTDNHVGQFRTELNIPVNASTDNHVGQFRTELNIPVNASTDNHVGQFRTELNIPVNSGVDNHAGRFRTELVIPIDSRNAVRKERENQKVSILKEDNGQNTLSYGNHDDKVILSVGSWSNSKNRLRQPTIHSVNMQNLARQKMQGKQTEETSGLHIIGGYAFYVADETKYHRLYE